MAVEISYDRPLTRNRASQIASEVRRLKRRKWYGKLYSPWNTCMVEDVFAAHDGRYPRGDSELYAAISDKLVDHLGVLYTVT